MFKIIITVVIVLGILYYLFPPIQIIGDSMYPTYKDGEVVCGSRVFRKSKLKKGDVIVYKTPTDGKIVIKRVDRIINYYRLGKLTFEFYCLGDNSDHSFDSRHYGYISSKKIVCKVINQRGIDNVCN